MIHILTTGLIFSGMILLNIKSVMATEIATARKIVPAPEESRFSHLSWPKVVKTKNGTIVLAYIAGRKHVNGDGCPAVSLSHDKGKTFTSPKILREFDKTKKYQHCGNLAMGIAKDGAIVLMAMAFTDNLRNNIYGWRSEDNGTTWKKTDTSALGESKTGSVFGHVFPVPGKGLAVCGHFRKPKGQGIWISYSEDNGKSWVAAQAITKEKYFEPTFISSGRQLIGLVRENSAHAYHQYASDDLGKSWKFRKKVIQGNKQAVHPAPFIVSDPIHPNRLFALQSERTLKNEIYLWHTQKDKLQWKRLRLVTSCPGVEDFSYPWMTHLTRKEWFVVFYAGKKDGPNSIYGMTITIP